MLVRFSRANGAGDLPVVQAIKFELVINLKTARTLGLQFPTHHPVMPIALADNANSAQAGLRLPVSLPDSVLAQGARWRLDSVNRIAGKLRDPLWRRPGYLPILRRGGSDELRPARPAAR
jgi:hypothetical protein